MSSLSGLIKGTNYLDKQTAGIASSITKAVYTFPDSITLFNSDKTYKKTVMSIFSSLFKFKIATIFKPGRFL
jgi:hypothetical protein